MPNHCRNRLTVFGAPERVSAFVEKARGRGQQYALTDFEMKEAEWRRESAEKRGETYDPNPVAAFSFHALVPIPDEVMAQKYDPAGYDAERHLWGVKWGGYDTSLLAHEPGRAEYTFTTAWGPADFFFETLSERWPDLRFVLSFGEEYPSRGRRVFANGVALYSPCEQGGPDAPEGLDEDAAYEFRRAWRDAYLADHREWAESVRDLPLGVPWTVEVKS